MKDKRKGKSEYEDDAQCIERDERDIVSYA